MAALTITAANIIKGTGAQTASGTAGETITAGMAVYIKSSDNKIYKADANASAEASAAVGVALHGALASQPIVYQVGGPLSFGAILTAGLIYVAGATTAGDINPSSDLASGWYTNIIGYALTTSSMQITPVNTGVALA